MEQSPKCADCPTHQRIVEWAEILEQPDNRSPAVNVARIAVENMPKDLVEMCSGMPEDAQLCASPIADSVGEQSVKYLRQFPHLRKE